MPSSTIWASGKRLFEVVGDAAEAEGGGGLEVFSANTASIGLIVLDLTMPRMSGKEVLSELTRISGDVRVILASGYSHPDSLPAGPNVAGFLHKPFRFDDLLSTIRRAVA